MSSLSFQALKGSKKLVLSVYSAGRIPGGYVTSHIYTWVDPQGRSISPPSGLPPSHGSTLRQREGDSRSNLNLLQGGDEKKVSRPASASACRPGAEGGCGSLGPRDPILPARPRTGTLLRGWRRGLVLLGLCSPLKALLKGLNLSSLSHPCDVYSETG